MKKKYNRISNVDEPVSSPTNDDNNNNNTSDENITATSHTATPNSPNSISNSFPTSPNNNSTTTSSSSSKNNSKSIPERLSEKIHAMLLIALSYYTIKYTDTISIIFTSTTIIRPLLYIAIALLSINTVLMLYLGIYIPKIKGINVDQINYQNYKRNLDEITNANNRNNTTNTPNTHHAHFNMEAAKGITTKVTNSDLWAVYCPRVIPIMTLNGVLCGIFLLRCFWPVWGFLTPFILGTEFFGLLFVTQFIPWC